MLRPFDMPSGSEKASGTRQTFTARLRVHDVLAKRRRHDQRAEVLSRTAGRLQQGSVRWTQIVELTLDQQPRAVGHVQIDHLERHRQRPPWPRVEDMAARDQGVDSAHHEQRIAVRVLMDPRGEPGRKVAAAETSLQIVLDSLYG